jgi:hypothetical protein
MEQIALRLIFASPNSNETSYTTESGSEVLLFGWILLDLAHPTKQGGKSGTVYITLE